MGCDIHLYVEKRDAEGVWRSADDWEPEEYDEDSEGNPLYHAVVPYEKLFYSGRNYELFAILADVRNGRGFAGCDTGDRLNPIDDPRDLPDDVSAAVRQCSNDWGCDGHSHSWFTIAELLAYDWTQVVVKRGYVSLKEYREWIRWRRGHGEGPEEYCGGVGGGSTRIVTEEEMQKLAAQEGGPDGFVYCQVSWTESYNSLARHFWWSCMPKLLALGKPEDVRIVFWFDN